MSRQTPSKGSRATWPASAADGTVIQENRNGSPEASRVRKSKWAEAT
jgi:hypothetical protein